MSISPDKRHLTRRTVVLSLLRGGDRNKATIVQRNPYTATSVFLRTAVAMKYYLEVDIVDSTERLEYYLKNDIQVDNIIVSFSTRYNHFEAELEFLKKCGKNARVFYMNAERENTLPASLFYYEGRFGVITNCTRITGIKREYDFYNINLNALTFRRRYNDINWLNRKYDIVYWGNFRPNRVKYFVKYLNDPRIHISTNRKNVYRYREAGVNKATYVGKLTWHPGRGSLLNYRFSIYLEDEITHYSYDHLANRFYESLNTGLILFWQSESMNTIERAGLEVPEFMIVDSREELFNRIADAKGRNTLRYTLVMDKWAEHALMEREIALEQLYRLFEFGEYIPEEELKEEYYAQSV